MTAKETSMHSSIRLVISFAIARIGCLATALLVLPAAAATNSWTAIGPVAYPFAVDPSSPSTIYSVVNRNTVIDPSPSSPSTVYPVVFGNTVTKTTDGGGHWADLAVLAPDQINSLVIDPRSSATIYSALGDPWDPADVPIYKSTDGGAHWAAAQSSGLAASVLAIAPSLSSILYAGEDNVVLKSIDGGLSWAMRGNGLPGFYVSALAIDPTNADAVYVAQEVVDPSVVPGGDTGKIFKSVDGGGKWQQVQLPVPAPGPTPITSLVIDPATPSVVYAAYTNGRSGGVFKSIDSGETWIATNNGLPDTILVNALAIDPSAPARIYAATDHGVFMSNDAAANWTPMNSGLTNLHVWSLSIDRSGSLLRAATAAGLFEYRLAANAAGIDLHQDGLTGSWYDARTSGQGFFVQVYPDLLAPGKGLVQVSWLTYDDVVGGAEHQRWYTLSGTVASGQTEVALTIYQNTGGNFAAPPITTAHPVGTATLSFDSCTSGKLTYNFMGRASTIALTRLMQNETCSATAPVPNSRHPAVGLFGNFFDDATSGQGLAIEVDPYQNSSVLFFAWMTYAPNGADAGPAGQRWYTGVGKFTGNPEGIPVQLYESTGGLFGQGEPVPTTVPVGSATLNFVNFCYLELSFNFTGGSSAGASGKLALGWAGTPEGGAGCWDY